VDYGPGSRWKSSVCDTEVVIVRKPTSSASLACGGVPMVPMGEEEAPGAVLDAALADGTQLGKRYVDEETGLEVLCTKGGAGTLTVDGRPLDLKGAKPLPASD
jgi:hypothetical protein